MTTFMARINSSDATQSINSHKNFVNRNFLCRGLSGSLASLIGIYSLCSLPHTLVAATIIGFSDGTHFSPVGATYWPQGLIVGPPKDLCLFNSTLPGVIPFPFNEGWGVVGALSSAVGSFSFTSPVDFVRFQGFAQGDASLGAAKPFQWTLTAYDANDITVATATQTYGYDYSVNQNRIEDGTYPIAVLSLRVDAIGAISRVDYVSDRKTGIDTLTFDPLPPPHIPEPSSMLLLLAGLGALLKRRQA